MPLHEKKIHFNFNFSFPFNSGFFHSKWEHNPWLDIQLTEPTYVTSLSIINRKDCCGGRLKNIEIRAGISPNISNEFIGRITGPGVTGDVHVLQFRTTLFVQYIKFQQIGGPGWLAINGVRLNRQPALDRTSNLMLNFLPVCLSNLLIRGPTGSFGVVLCLDAYQASKIYPRPIS